MVTLMIVVATKVVVNDGKPLLLHRRYEEIRWVYRLLAYNVDIGGNIVSNSLIV